MFWCAIFALWLFPTLSLPFTPMFDEPLDGSHVVVLALMFMLGYVPVAFMVNRTRWELAGNQLRIRHRPLPWLGGRDFDLSNAVQVYCKDESGYRNPYRSLQVLTTDGHSEKLWGFNVNMVPDAQVVAIERHLEEALEIVDQPVAGEFQRVR